MSLLVHIGCMKQWIMTFSCMHVLYSDKHIAPLPSLVPLSTGPLSHSSSSTLMCIFLKPRLWI